MTEEHVLDVDNAKLVIDSKTKEFSLKNIKGETIVLDTMTIDFLSKIKKVVNED